MNKLIAELRNLFRLKQVEEVPFISFPIWNEVVPFVYFTIPDLGFKIKLSIVIQAYHIRIVKGGKQRAQNRFSSMR